MIYYTSTGSQVLDYTIGGGFPWGKIINIVGDKSTGKTLLACETIAQSFAVLGNSLKWFYDDAEAGFSFDTEKIYDLSIINEDQEFSETLEDFECNLTKQLDKLEKDQYLIYVLDSFDSLSTRAEIERANERHKKIEKGESWKKDSYNLEKNQLFNEFFRLRRRQIKDKNCILIVLSQVRENIGVMFGKKYRRNGEKALDFYSAQVLWLAEVEKYFYSNGRSKGICTKVYCDKNKVGRPFGTCFIEINYDYGIDDLRTSLKYLYDLKTDLGKDKALLNKEKKSKKKDNRKEEYLFNWDNEIGFNDFEEMVKYIDNNNLYHDLEARVVSKWQKYVEESSFESQGRKSKIDLLKSIGDNINNETTI